MSSRWTAFAVLLLAVVLGSPEAAEADLIRLEAVMTCAKANRGMGTCQQGATGEGLAVMTFNTANNQLIWAVFWEGLSGAATVAHFHGPATPTENAGVVLDFSGIGSGLESPSIGEITISVQDAQQLLAGLWYSNVHSTTFGSGEIRGQIPEPDKTLMAVIAVLVLAAVAYWKRRSGGDGR